MESIERTTSIDRKAVDTKHHVVRQDRSEYRNSNRYGHLPLGAEDRRGATVVGWRDGCVARRLHRHERESHAEPAQQHEAANPPKVGVESEPVEREDRERRQEQPDKDESARAHALVKRTGNECRAADTDGLWKCD